MGKPQILNPEPSYKCGFYTHEEAGLSFCYARETGKEREAALTQGPAFRA